MSYAGKPIRCSMTASSNSVPSAATLTTVRPCRASRARCASVGPIPWRWRGSPMKWTSRRWFLWAVGAASVARPISTDRASRPMPGLPALVPRSTNPACSRPRMFLLFIRSWPPSRPRLSTTSPTGASRRSAWSPSTGSTGRVRFQTPLHPAWSRDYGRPQRPIRPSG